MTKEQIIDLIKAQEQELYADFKHCERQYCVEHKHTRFAFGQWGALVNLLETIKNNENNENN
jgi:hypothetical protein